MRHMNKNILTVAGLSVLLLTQTTLTSCGEKELCYTHPHGRQVSVQFDWRHAPDARPVSMSLYLFPMDGESSAQYEFAGRKGGMIDLSPGSYGALCANDDSPRNYFRNTNSRKTFEVYTREVRTLEGVDELISNLPRAKDAGDEPVVHEPDSVWCDVTQSPFVLPGVRDSVSLPHALTLYPRPLFRTCTVEIQNVENLKYTRGTLSATLSGLSGGVMVASGVPTDERVTVPFILHSRDTTTLVGSFRTFGYTPGKQASHRLVVYATLRDGGRRYFTYDVTSQVRNSTDPLHIHIVLDKLPLPKAISGGDGLKVTLGKWKDGGTIPIKL